MAPDPEWLMKAVKKERAAYRQLWEGVPDQAAEAFLSAFAEAQHHERALAAWYLHLAALARLAQGEGEQAANLFSRAASTRSALGRMTGLPQPTESEPSAQAVAIAEVLLGKRGAYMDAVDKINSWLEYGADTSRAEEAVRVLGMLLGFEATRPDADPDINRGPDVLWVVPDVAAGDASTRGAWFELKTDKEEGGSYSKDEIGQVHNHATYIEETFPGSTFYQRIVGHLLSVSAQASPSPELGVVTVDSMSSLAARVTGMYHSLDTALRAEGRHDSADPLARRVQGWLDRDGLTWPDCVDGLNTSLAIDLIP